MCCMNSTDKGVFIGVLGAITDLIKSVIRKVLAGRPSHVAGRLWVLASTDSKLRVPFHHLLENVTTKETHRWLQSGAGRPTTHWAHTSMHFAHNLLMSGAFLR
jgi:hypothetical protein